MFHSCKSQFREKNPILPIEQFPFLTVSCTSQEYDNVTTPHYPLFAPSSASGRLREVKNKGNFQTFGCKSGRGRLQEVPNIAI